MEVYLEISFKEAMRKVGSEEVSNLYIKYKAGESIVPYIYVKEDYYTLSQSQFFVKGESIPLDSFFKEETSKEGLSQVYENSDLSNKEETV